MNQLYKLTSMERLAAQGMKFTNAYSCPLCSPGRTSLIDVYKRQVTLCAST